MYIVTGGAGFIGSNLAALIEARALGSVVVADTCDTPHKTRNLAKRRHTQVIPPEALFGHLDAHASEIKGVFHLGALTSTTERDLERLQTVNVRLSQDIWHWCTRHETPLIYASSAATYGDGSQGFDDDDIPEALARLKPLNPYGQSKHDFDLWVAQEVERGAPTPPTWAGLKFFNVYGPNEFHKGAQASLVPQVYAKAKADAAFALFRSHHPDYADGEQKRDFIFVDDCCDVMLWLQRAESVHGLFNLGTGGARTFRDLATAVYTTAGRTPQIVYRDTPEDIRDQYQYFTQARMERLRAAGYQKTFTTLEDGVDQTVRILSHSDPYR